MYYLPYHIWSQFDNLARVEKMWRAIGTFNSSQHEMHISAISIPFVSFRRYNSVCLVFPFELFHNKQEGGWSEDRWAQVAYSTHASNICEMQYPHVWYPTPTTVPTNLHCSHTTNQQSDNQQTNKPTTTLSYTYLSLRPYDNATILQFYSALIQLGSIPAIPQTNNPLIYLPFPSTIR